MKGFLETTCRDDAKSLHYHSIACKNSPPVTPCLADMGSLGFKEGGCNDFPERNNWIQLFWPNLVFLSGLLFYFIFLCFIKKWKIYQIILQHHQNSNIGNISSMVHWGKVFQQWNTIIIHIKKKDYKDTFFKTHFKALKMTTPITVFLKWTEFEWADGFMLWWIYVPESNHLC